MGKRPRENDFEGAEVASSDGRGHGASAEAVRGDAGMKSAERGRQKPAGFGGLVVARFRPQVTGMSSTSLGSTDVDPVETSDKPAKKMTRSSTVDPTFARIFRGGPRRAEADLPVQDDEGVETVPEALPTPNVLQPESVSWLTSLGGDPSGAGDTAEGEGQEEARARTNVASIDRAPESEVDWVTSLKRGKASLITSIPAKESAAGVSTPLAADAWLSPAAAVYRGKPLPIPPFWRTEPRHKLKRELLQDRKALLTRMRRMAKDAQRLMDRRSRGPRAVARAERD